MSTDTGMPVVLSMAMQEGATAIHIHTVISANQLRKPAAVSDGQRAIAVTLLPSRQ